MTAPENDNFTNPIDSRGNEFNPFAGSSTIQDGRCNAVLTDWRHKYGSKRYCTQFPEHTYPSVEDGSDRCRTHKSRDNTFMRANELLEEGLQTQSIFHFYDKIHPTKKLLALAWYTDLMDQSVFDYDSTERSMTVDFSDFDKEEIPPVIDGNSITVDVPFATQKVVNANALFAAATHSIKQMNVDGTLIENDMERETVVDSEFDYETNEWNELLGTEEHHLNLAYDRLLRTHEDLLEMGGVGIEDDSEPEQVADTHIEVYGDPSDTDPIDPEMLNDEESLNIPVQ